jgi:hypothetical protein
LREAIASVLEQTAGDWELIVVDDGSTDETAAVVAEYLSDGRIRYCPRPGGGRSAARNHGIAEAHGEFVCFLDSDDRYVPTALADHLEVVAEQGHVGMTVGGYRYIDEVGTVTGERRPWTEGGELNLEGWLFNCYGIPGSVLVRRDWLERSGGFDRECEIAEDWDLFLRLAIEGCPTVWTRTLVCEYRRHPGSSVRDIRLHRQGATAALDKVFDRPDVTPGVSALEGLARAWLHVASARRAAAAGDDELVRESLRAAREAGTVARWQRRGWSISPHGFPSLLEPLVADAVDREAARGSAVDETLSGLPARWAVGRDDVLRAAARVDMRRFFASRALGAREEAAVHVRAGLRRDARWLGNRAVMAFLLERLLRR